MQKEYFIESGQVLKELGTSLSGLSADQVLERQAKYGFNRLKEGEKQSLIQKFFKELANFMTIVLIAAAVVSAVTSFYAGEDGIVVKESLRNEGEMFLNFCFEVT